MATKKRSSLKITKSISSASLKNVSLPASILILSGNHVSCNPRVIKEADAFSELGYQVTVVGGTFVPELTLQDEQIVAGKKWKYLSAYDFTKRGALSFVLRAQRKLGELAFKKVGLQNPWQLNYGSSQLLKFAKSLKPGLTLAHSEPGMWAAEKLRQEGRRVGVDMEDWFSEDLLPEARRNRPIRLLKKLERNLLCHGDYSSCTSKVMADALVKEYGCRRPLVIRNVFPIKDREGLDGKWKDRPGMAKLMGKNDPTAERPKEAPVSIHWFSQTIGPGRGLEILFQALEGMEGSWEVHLRGNLKGYENWLEEACSGQVRQKLTLHGLVENRELISRIAEHDIGYAGELCEPASRNLTITNKLFQYLQSGLVVLASDTKGQKEAAKEAQGAICLFQAGQFIRLKEQLKHLMRNPQFLCQMKQTAWRQAEKLCWEKEKQKIHA